MKSYHLGFLIKSDVNYKLRKIVGEIGRVFDGQNIPVTWFNPETFTVEVMNFGYSFHFLKRFLLEQKLSKVVANRIEVNFNKCEVGIFRKYKGLIYISLESKENRLRDFVFTIRGRLKIDDFSNYIPRISVGRVNKDITTQEYTNIKSDLNNISSSMVLDDIKFNLEDLVLYEINNSQLKVLKNFSIFSKATS